LVEIGFSLHPTNGLTIETFLKKLLIIPLRGVWPQYMSMISCPMVQIIGLPIET
jgi:hypothetical protein